MTEKSKSADSYVRYVIRLDGDKPVEGMINAKSTTPFVDIFSSKSLAKLSRAYLDGAIEYDEYRARERQMNPVKFGDPLPKNPQK